MKKAYIAELIGTMILVLIGCGSAVIAGEVIGNVGISLAFGLTIVAMAYSIGPISGCHVNPAVSIGVWVAGRMERKDMLLYILFQIIGAFIGIYLLFGIVGSSASGLGSNVVNIEDFTMLQGIMFETIFTFIFVFVILGATKKGADNSFAGLTIGLTLVVIHLVGIPITGTSVNPARSIAPALFSMQHTAVNQLWIFILFPIIGAVIAGVVGKYLFDSEE